MVWPNFDFIQFFKIKCSQNCIDTVCTHPIRIPALGNWMDYRCRLGFLGNSFTASGISDPGGDGWPELLLGLWDIFFTATVLYSLIFSHLLPLFLCLNPFLLVPCAGVLEYSCMSCTFAIAILNGTCSLCSVKTTIRSGSWVLLYLILN